MAAASLPSRGAAPWFPVRRQRSRRLTAARLLAIDLGDRRTGFAVGDATTGVVTPLEVVEVSSRLMLIDAIRRIIAEQEPGAIVLGLPLNMDGTEGDRAKLARAFGAELAEAIDLPIEYQDERLTSYAADQLMARSGRTHGQKKKIRDALAAAELLRTYLGG